MNFSIPSITGAIGIGSNKLSCYIIIVRRERLGLTPYKNTKRQEIEESMNCNNALRFKFLTCN